MTTQNDRLNNHGKIIIITGANGNLGSAVTKLFLNKGYLVIATVHNEEGKNELPSHTNLRVHVVDLTSETAAASFIQQTIALYKKVDGALMLVGGFTMGDISETTINDIKKQISLNFNTAYNIARPVLMHMLSRNYGRIIFIGARPAIDATAGKKMIAYGLSKSLLFKLAEYINHETKGKNITATVLVPGTIDTEENRKAMPNADFDSWVKPETLAEIMEFICSEKSAALRDTVLKVYNNS